MIDKNVLEKECLFKYMIVKQANLSVADLLLEKGIKKINIIGGNELALLLYNDIMEAHNIEIENIVNHKDVKIGKIVTVTWKQWVESGNVEADMAIVTYLHTKTDLIANLNKMNTKRACGLDELVEELYKRVQLYNPMKKVIRDLIKRGVDVRYYHYPVVREITNKSEWEKFLFKKNLIASDLRKETSNYKEELVKVFGNKYDYDYIDKSIINFPLPPIYRSGVRVHKDVSTSYYNVINGVRVTEESCYDCDYKVHIFGSSYAFGKYDSDKETISSNLQRMYNSIGERVRVINYGVQGVLLDDVSKNMEAAHIEQNDKVLIVNNGPEFEALLKDTIPVISFKDFIEDKSQGEIFVDFHHMNPKGDALFSEKIFYDLKETKHSNFVSDIEDSKYNSANVASRVEDYFGTDRALDKMLQRYLSELPKKPAGLVGSIVMNCNPFTNGHRYLIESAAEKVDHLFIFVVQEDKSIFAFEDRFALVKKGTADIKNVTVIPSGKFIISAATFPEYFVKEDQKEVIIDASNDLKLFGKEIAPRLGISIRFAGTEPKDMVTAQYNKQMASLLPEYGIKFWEIPRKECDEEVISASSVRKCIKDGNIELLKQLVPKVTYEYLVERGYVSE